MSLKPAIYDFLLDPACGTGTFLYMVIEQIREQFQRAGNSGMWSSYVRQHLLPRLFGFELLMPPYAMAHLKLGMQLAGMDLAEAERPAWAYDFAGDERLGVYLTNTLEEAAKRSEMLMGRYISDEANAAASVKKEYPVMVVLGNPPYSGHSANKGNWITGLLRGTDTQSGTKTGNYFEVDGKPLGERNPKWLNDAYLAWARRPRPSGRGMNGPSPADEQWWWYPLLSSSAPVQLHAVSAVPPSIVPAGTSSTVGEQVPSQSGVCEERPLHWMKPNERCGTTHQRHSRSPRLEPWGVVT